jgi:hypothetical protein
MLTLKQEVVDLGMVKFGSPRTFEVEVTNTLGKDMPVNRLQVSCSSCTKAHLPTKIKGNETVMMKITYTPGIVGETSKYVDVVYDKDQVLRVKFKATVHE